jgi:prepilin-type processing-associated H-X9-DG protein
VVVGVIGLLAALIIPAVQAARESARRAECQNKLKQIGIALAGHAEQTGYYPGAIASDSPDGSSSARIASAHLFLLPFLEQTALFNGVNLQVEGRIADLPANRTAATTVVDAWLCPSDPGDARPGVNYRAACGPLPYEIDSPPSVVPGGGGVFVGLRHVRPSQITDGLSQTVGFSERLRGSEGSRFDRGRDFWFSEYNKIGHARDADTALEVCGALSGKPLAFWARSGASWLLGRYTDTMYNHVAQPNWSGPDCSLDDEFGAPGDSTGGAFSARSHHPNGVHCLFMDGSVRFQRNAVELKVWRALGSRSGGEVVALD